jgi:hypothetical protein
MTKTPSKERKNRWWLYLLVISLPFLVLTIFAGYRLHCVMGLQDAVVGAHYIGFRNSENLNTERWDEDVINYLGKKAADWGIEFSRSSQERCRAVLLSRIDTVGVTNPKGLTREFGAALARFPHLRVFNFVDSQGTPLSAKDVATLLAALHRMKRLEEINLFSSSVTDSSFAALAGHPTLSKVNFGWSSITPEGTATLKTLPNLKEVTLITSLQHHDAWTQTSTQRAFRDSLRGVKVEIVDRWK